MEVFCIVLKSKEYFIFSTKTYQKYNFEYTYLSCDRYIDYSWLLNKFISVENFIPKRGDVAITPHRTKLF